ncbi:SH2/SH3 adapter protein dreadlocks-like [Centruroides vittatus]|uniref:cytoplasmic protein NCK2-like n=1 Tax=Centruroides sculpturatus TaxID=218467 RepID=UPI000C6E5CA5|nr:cytoplasmic protein NCK2-like [Centruroides sculpturatus]
MSNPKMGKTGEEVYVIAKYDYTAQGSQELDIHKNEKLILLDDSKHWWKVQNSKNQAGFVPSNYVKREKPSIFDSIRRKVKKKSEPKMSPTSSPVAAKESDININPSKNLPVVNQSEINTTALAKYNYEAQQSDEISLIKGTRVLVLEKSSDGWWKGETNGQVGWFPSNYVQEEVDEIIEVSQNCAPVLVPESMPVNHSFDIVIALYTFTSQNEEELCFQKGEQLEIIQRPSNDPDWWKARNKKGEIGLVPKNYLKVISKGKGKISESETAAVKGFVPDIPNCREQDINGAEQEMSKLGLGASGGVSNAVKDVVNRPDLSNKEWFFGSITRGQCDQMLNEFAEDGDFVIRESETNLGDYSVSLKASTRNKHFRVHVEDGVFCIGQRRFNTLDELVEHYKKAPIYTSPHGEKLYLIKSFQRPR